MSVLDALQGNLTNTDYVFMGIGIVAVLALHLIIPLIELWAEIRHKKYIEEEKRTRLREFVIMKEVQTELEHDIESILLLAAMKGS